MDALNKEISLNIIMLMKLKGKSKSVFCTKFEYNSRRVTKMLENKISWDIDTIKDFSKFLETDIKQLIFPITYSENETISYVSESSGDVYLINKVENLSKEIGMLTFQLNMKEKEIEILKNKNSD